MENNADKVRPLAPGTSEPTPTTQTNHTTSTRQRSLTMAALATHDENELTVIYAEENAAKARVAAMQQAAEAIGAQLPGTDPYTGNYIGEGWIQSQVRTYGRYVDCNQGN